MLAQVKLGTYSVSMQLYGYSVLTARWDEGGQIHMNVHVEVRACVSLNACLRMFVHVCLRAYAFSLDLLVNECRLHC